MYQILQYRNEEALQSSSRKIERHSIDIATSTTLSNQDSRTMTTMATQARHDSKLVKILTVTGILYLPANLVAVSTGLSHPALYISGQLWWHEHANKMCRLFSIRT